MKFLRPLTVLLGIGLCFASQVWATTFPLPPAGSDIVGHIRVVHANAGERLVDIGEKYDVGYHEMEEANNGLNPVRRLRKGTRVIVPTQYVLPQVPRKGIIINLAELRLYYFPEGRNVVMTYPIGIGRRGWITPTADTKVIGKRYLPSWNVPKSIHDHILATKGIDLPKVVPPGPDNPLGKYAMRLGLSSYLIHGTNFPFTIGRRVSSGCIRLLPKDIKQLYKATPIGAPVRIINEAYKVGWAPNGRLYLEAHAPLSDAEHTSTLEKMDNAVHAATKNKSFRVDWDLARRNARQKNGIPVAIGHSADNQS